jgi:hypothetical protein
MLHKKQTYYSQNTIKSLKYTPFYRFNYKDIVFIINI